MKMNNLRENQNKNPDTEDVVNNFKKKLFSYQLRFKD